MPVAQGGRLAATVEQGDPHPKVHLADDLARCRAPGEPSGRTTLRLADGLQRSVIQNALVVVPAGPISVAEAKVHGVAHGHLGHGNDLPERCRNSDVPLVQLKGCQGIATASVQIGLEPRRGKHRLDGGKSWLSRRHPGYAGTELPEAPAARYASGFAFFGPARCSSFDPPASASLVNRVAFLCRLRAADHQLHSLSTERTWRRSSAV